MKISVLILVTLTAIPSHAFDLSNLVYQGAFRVPDGMLPGAPGTEPGPCTPTWCPTDGRTFDYGGTAIGFDPADGRLFMAGHDHQQFIAKISIPTPMIDPDDEALPMATLEMPFHSVKNFSNWPDGHNMKVGGLLPYNNRLIGSWFSYYDNDFLDQSHFSSNLDLSDAEGLYELDSPTGAGMVAGYMAEVPTSLQDEIGAPAVTGLMGVSIVGRTSFGAALFGFDPADLTGSNLNEKSTIPLVNYPQHQPEPYAGGPFDFDSAFHPVTNPFNSASAIRGVFFHEPSQTVAMVGSQGIGQTCYKETCDTPSGGGGVIGDQWLYGIWVYQLSDFVDVRNGIKEPWELRPSAWHQLSFPQSGTRSLGMAGVAFDPATKRLFMSQSCATGNCAPIVQTFTLDGVAGPPVAPTITRQPINKTVRVGQMGSFVLGVTGTQPMTFQWQRNGIDILGATFSFYTTPDTTLADNGSRYRCIINNSAGPTISQEAILTVTTNPSGGGEPGSLLKNVFNPLRETVELYCDGETKIFAQNGGHVRTLYCDPAVGIVTWDGLNGSEKLVAAGAYTYNTGGSIHKVVVLK